MVVIAGATTHLGPAYATYFAQLGFQSIVLIDSDEQEMSLLKQKLLKDYRDRKEGPPLSVFTYAFDLTQDISLQLKKAEKEEKKSKRLAGSLSQRNEP